MPRRATIPTRVSSPVTPNTTVSELARNVLLDELNGSELVVYLRLLGLRGDQKSRTIQTVNATLYRDGKTAARALEYLDHLGLVKVKPARRGRARVIYVPR